ncbi:MAG: T9SS type A sorting domain-containing protein [Bacteroidales bacterium]|nr:T9SS type A sorting domain-containing protein [Bacteroidales bacterium]
MDLRRTLALLAILGCFSFRGAAQDSLILTFQSSLHLDSIRIENLNNGSFRVLEDADTILFDFYVPPPVDTTTHADTTTNASSVFSPENPRFLSDPLVFPNPFDGQTIVEFHAADPGMANLAVYDLAGKLVKQIEQYVERGSHRYLLSLPYPGLHLVRVSNRAVAGSALLLNSGGSSFDPGIEYVGAGNFRPPAGGFLKAAQVVENSADTLTAKRGDLLRFTGYAGGKLEMIYDFLVADSTYDFAFPDVAPGVYLDFPDTLLADRDTIWCFAKSSGYLFGADAEGEIIFAEDSLLLRPVTHGAGLQPVYDWENADEANWHINRSFYVSGTLSPLTYKGDTTVVTLTDQVNGLSGEFVLVRDPDDFVGPAIALAEIQDERTLDEISGMAASVKNPGYYWVHNDSGDEARIFLINTEGEIISTVNIDTDYTDNRDWEDIAVGPGPEDGETYIYIGEIGDLNRGYSNKFIFRIVEPEINTGSLNQQMDVQREAVSTIRYDYADGSRDAEILLIDPLTKDLYIVTKREEHVQIYVLLYPQDYSEEKIILTKSAVTLPFRMTNGGDISADGREILIKNLDHVFYWKLEEGESILDALSRPSRKLPYKKEPQGEAIAWLRDGTGYLTVSEEKDNITPVIYLYQRK